MALNEDATLVQVVDEMERLNNLIIDRGGPKTITPSTSNQVLSKGNYKGDITILGDANLIEQNIKQGVTIFGKTGTLRTFRKIAGDEKIYLDDTANRYSTADTSKFVLLKEFVIDEEFDSLRVSFNTRKGGDWTPFHKFEHVRGTSILFTEEYKMSLSIIKDLNDIRVGDSIKFYGKACSGYYTTPAEFENIMMKYSIEIIK